MSYAFCKWGTIFKWNSSIITTTCWCYIPCYKNICVWIIPKILFNDFGFEFDGCTTFISFIIVRVILIHFLVANFQYSLLVSPNKFTIFWVSIFILSENQITVTAFCENSKVAISDFSMIKKIVVFSFLVSLPMNLICCFKSECF